MRSDVKMANLFTNNLKIEGKEISIRAVFKAYKENKLFDSQMIRPPKHLREISKKPKELQPSLLWELLDWRYENWCCRRPFLDVRLTYRGDSSLSFKFYSENGAPFPLMEKISKRFRSVTLKFESYSMLDSFMAEYHYKKGKVQSFKQGTFEDFGIQIEIETEPISEPIEKTSVNAHQN